MSISKSENLINSHTIMIGNNSLIVISAGITLWLCVISCVINCVNLSNSVILELGFSYFCFVAVRQPSSLRTLEQTWVSKKRYQSCTSTNQQTTTMMLTAGTRQYEDGLIDAVTVRDHTRLRSFLSARGDVNVRGRKEDTALMIATSIGDIAAVELLLKYNADVNAANQYGITALHLAAAVGRAEILKLLLQNDAIQRPDRHGSYPIHEAASHGFIECCRLLVKYHGEINAVRPDGQSALHIAAACGQTECVQALIQMGAVANPTDRWGRTPKRLSRRRSTAQLLGQETERRSAESEYQRVLQGLVQRHSRGPSRCGSQSGSRVQSREGSRRTSRRQSLTTLLETTPQFARA
eukprot:m.229407 g.229407  ORF g.229407 m.229407 type:complete len:352 (+) comp15210_c0_seq1:130-1185(+)